MKKINVIGTSGSGKSTIAKELSKRLNYPYIEMDAVFWGKNWSEPPDEIFFKNLRQALERESWVLDGNYTRSMPIKWQKVDTVVWVDYNFARTLYQAVSRAINRIITQKELWPGTGNRESFKMLFSKDSIVLWTIKTYHKNRIKYLKAMKDEQYKHIHFIHLRSPKESREFLNKVSL